MSDSHYYAAASVTIEITRSGEKTLVEIGARRRTYDEDVRLATVEIVAPTHCSVSALNSYLRAVVADALLDPGKLTIKRNLEAFEPD